MDLSKLSRGWRLLIVFLGYMLLLYLVFLAIDKLYLPAITAGTAEIRTPNIVGMKFDAAQRTIASKDLAIEVVKEIYNEKFSQGVVVSQVPAARSTVKKGRIVFVTVSKGKELVPVPYIVGLLQRTAKINLMKVGLELGNISYDFSDNVGKDTIISQSIAPNAKVPYGQLVNIVISKGSEAQIKVPSLIGLSLSEATNILSELGLIVGNIGYKPDATYLPDVITDQSPQPGLIAAPGDAVNITITK